MRIVNNTASALGCRNLKVNDSNKNSSVEKLTSGFKVNRAADDAAGVAISEKMRSQIKGLSQASINSQDGVSLTQTIEGATVEVHEMLHRMKKLAIQASNGTCDDDDRKLVDGEVQQLKSEINRIASQTEFNGKKVLDGSYGDGGEQLDIQIGENPGFIIGFKPINSISCESLNIDSVDFSTEEGAKKSIKSLNDAIEEVSKRRVEIGSVQNRIEHAVKSVDNTNENVTASESRIRDTDMAYEEMENVKSSILINSTESLLVQSNHDPEYVLKLINEK